jgi:hypothetical protein
VNRPLEVLRGAVSTIRDRFAAVAGQSDRTILIGTVLLASAVSAVVGFVFARYYSVDVLSSLIFPPNDCWLDWGTKVGQHCFSDYTMPVVLGMRPNPWAPYQVFLLNDNRPFMNNYPPATMMPHMAFGLFGKWVEYPPLGLFGYLLALSIAVFAPGVWAARGARGYERLVVFIVCGLAATPAWMAIDRGNSVGFVVPIALVFLVALCRGQWRLVAIMVILAALVKPQFAVLAIALFAARQWRWGGVATCGAVVVNFAAYLLWPHDLPQTIAQSMRGMLGAGPASALLTNFNVSFGKGLLTMPDAIKALETGGTIPDGFLAGPRSLIGYVVLVLVVVSVLALGRRIPAVMVGIMLLATASLFPAVSNRYYLVFALPVAALIVRDPDGPPQSGIFDRLAAVGGRRHAVGICVSIATALSIAQIPLPGPPTRVPIMGQLGVPGISGFSAPLVDTTARLAPNLWLIALAAIIISYARKPARWCRTERPSGDDGFSDTASDSSPRTAELMTES